MLANKACIHIFDCYLLKLPLLHGKSLHCPHVAKCLICHPCCFCHLCQHNASSSLNSIGKQPAWFSLQYNVWFNDVILQAFLQDSEWGGSAPSPVLALCGTVCGERSQWERRRPLGREAQSPLSPWVSGRWCRGKQNIPPSVWHYEGPASMETRCYTA